MPTYSEVTALINDYSIDAVRAYNDNFGTLDTQHFQDSFEGEYDYQSEVDEMLIEQFIDCMQVPDNVANYLDEEQVAREMRFDYSVVEHGGKVYLFRNC